MKTGHIIEMGTNGGLQKGRRRGNQAVRIWKPEELAMEKAEARTGAPWLTNPAGGRLDHKTGIIQVLFKVFFTLPTRVSGSSYALK